MRLLALAAVLAAGLAGPAAAAIDLGPIAYGLNNGITSAPVEQSSLGFFADEFTFTVTGAPRATVRALFRVFADDPDQFRHRGLFLFIGPGITFLPLAGSGVGVFDVPSDGTTFRLEGTALALPTSYTVSVTVTPVPAGVFLLLIGIAALAAGGHMRSRTQNAGTSNDALL